MLVVKRLVFVAPNMSPRECKMQNKSAISNFEEM